MITTSSTCKSLLGRVHLRRYCKLSRNSFRQRDQNSFAKCWTRLQRFLQYIAVRLLAERHLVEQKQLLTSSLAAGSGSKDLKNLSLKSALLSRVGC